MESAITFSDEILETFERAFFVHYINIRDCCMIFDVTREILFIKTDCGCRDIATIKGYLAAVATNSLACLVFSYQGNIRETSAPLGN